MVVGQRADVTVRNRVLHLPESVLREVSKGRLHPAFGMDYFAIARNRFPWHLVPPRLVIGRPKYDNFLLALASACNVSVVDATETLTALHQTDEDGLYAGHRRNDSEYNRQILGKLPWPRGCEWIKCTEYRTTWLSFKCTTNDSFTHRRKRISVKRR